MTAADEAANTGGSTNQEQLVRVYGNDHSPWVQAVLFGLEERGARYVLETAPPREVFLHSGVLMPAAEFGDGAWILDSGRILETLGFSEVEAEDRQALQDLFLRAAMNRTDDAWQFWHRFSLSRDGNPKLARRCWNHFWRAFSMLYFFTVIRLGRRRVSAPSMEERLDGLADWEARLSGASPFLGGEAPDTVDLQLFGIVQMCASIPGPTLELLTRHADLVKFREWIASMQDHFRDCGHLYSADYFSPPVPSIATTTPFERLFYWAGALTMWLALPITIPLTLFLVQSIRKRGLV